MTQPETAFLESVEEAVSLADSKSIGSAVSDFSSFSYKDVASAEDNPPFSDDFVDALLRVIAAGSFLEMEDSFRLLTLFQSDWARFSAAQRAHILGQLESDFNKFEDHTSHLVIAELLGEYVASAEALRSLDRLRSVPDETARAHIAHGYGLLARYTADRPVRAAALARLQEMSQDASLVVAQEVASVLSHPDVQ